MQNLRIGVQDGFISKQTASERASKYTKNDETDRLLKEYKEKQELDLLYEVKKKKAEVEAEIEKTKQISKIEVKNGNVRTGNGRTRTTDQNGNHEGENNWDQWNETH
jgi:adenine deaminase